VELAQHLPDDAGRLAEGRVRAHTHLVHGVQDAPLHRFQAVAGIRQGAGDDDAHGIVEICPAHLLVDIDLSDRPDFHAR